MAVPAESEPSNSVRDAKGLALDLKKTLKSSAPWERPVEDQRYRLRDQYVNLIFHNIRADLAQQLLWSETTYAIINSYRARIHKIERAIAEARPGPKDGPRHPTHGPVELRKVSHAFRAFLLQEENFWAQFSIQLVRSFGLVKVAPILARVGISEEPTLDGENGSRHNERRFVLSSEEERVAKMDMLQRAVVYLGDLARYRDLNDATSIAGKRPKDRSGAETPNRSSSSSFGLSESYYHAAISLAPQNGTPFNQLAIVSTYQADQFSALYYYYRAACTQHPFGTVEENLDRLLAKAIQTYKHGDVEGRNQAVHTQMRPDPADVFKRDVVTLHALWARNSRSTSTKLSQSIEIAFPHLLTERVLPVEVALRVLLMAFAAMWRAEGCSTVTPAEEEGPHSRNLAEDAAVNISRILRHILKLLIGLFDSGHSEMHQIIAAGPDVNPFLRISAVLRRILPVIRLSSRWMRARFSTSDHAIAPDRRVAEECARFWTSYLAFVEGLRAVFPVDVLPGSSRRMEEDIAVEGFLPVPLPIDSPRGLDFSEDPHPNEEHLMRVADLLVDAWALSRLENTPFQTSHPAFLGLATLFPPSKQIAQDHIQAVKGEEAIFSVSISSEKGDDISTTTSDDPVNMAMRASLEHGALVDMDNQDEEDDDVVLFPRTATHKNSESGPTAQDLLLQALGPMDLSTPKSAQRVVPANLALPVKSVPSISQQPLLFGANIWSGSVPIAPLQDAARSAPTPPFGQRTSSHGFRNAPRRTP